MVDQILFLAVSATLFCLLKAAHPASYYSYHPTVVKHEIEIPNHEIPHDDHHHDLKYEFGYRVHDPHYHNYQERAEAGGGDDVEGYYSFLEPNGFIRIVKYSSDKDGFRADVAHHVPSGEKKLKHSAKAVPVQGLAQDSSYFPIPKPKGQKQSAEFPYA